MLAKRLTRAVEAHFYGFDTALEDGRDLGVALVLEFREENDGAEIFRECADGPAHGG